MNVALLLSCSSFEGFFGGILGQTLRSYLETYRGDWSWYYARGLLDNGIRPLIYIPSQAVTGRFETPEGIAVRFLPLSAWYGPMEKVWLKRLCRQSAPMLYLDEYLNTKAFMAPLQDALVADEIDLLYVQEYWSGRFDYLVERVSVPVVGADHGGTSDGVLKFRKRQAFRKAKAIYTQTAAESDIVRALGGRAIFLPNGYDASRFFPDPMVTRQKTILTVARLTNRQKRTSDLIRALAHLGEEWTLDIVGTGPDLDLLKQVAASAGTASRVRFHGFVGRDAVRDQLRRCGVYAMPSQNEAMAIAVLEAMGCGCSVVASRIRAFEALITDGVNGRLVPVGDIAALAAAIEEAWTKRAERGAAATETVHHGYNSRVIYRELSSSLQAALTVPSP